MMIKTDIPIFYAKTLLICSVLFTIKTLAQIQHPQAPAVQPFQPVNIGQPIYHNNNYNNPNYSTSYPTNHTDNMMRSANDNAMRAMGYKPPVIPPSDPMERHQFIINQYKQSQEVSEQQLNEIKQILGESYQQHQRNANADHNKAVNDFVKQTQAYSSTLKELKQMLSGIQPLSLKRAYFLVENAYGNTYINYNNYEKTIQQSADFIKSWLQQNGYSLSDNQALNYGIQRFLSDTLFITNKKPDGNIPISKQWHYPYFYDYDDYKGERDFRNYFLTKTVATGSGQCNSLPALYLALAEAIGAKAYLTLAPLHSFIKFPDGKGRIYNYEPTSNWNISDQWYFDNLFISAEARRSKIYLDTFNTQQVVANSIIDLAHSFIRKFDISDGSFIKDCAATAAPYFPQKNNIHLYFLNSIYWAHTIAKVRMQHQIVNDNDVATHPKTASLYNAFRDNEAAIDRMGYQPLPPEVYEQMMKEQEFKGRQQADKKLSGKTYRNLFSTTN